MCDYSLQSVKSRDATVGDTLITRNFGEGTRGFGAVEEAAMAVCLLPGTELAFAEDVKCIPTGLLPWLGRTIKHKTAIFRKINTKRLAVHHDALEFPNGRIVLLTHLREGQTATVLQLPVTQKVPGESEAARPAAYSG
jgi:hypothetical protein